MSTTPFNNTDEEVSPITGLTEPSIFEKRLNQQAQYARLSPASSTGIGQYDNAKKAGLLPSDLYGQNIQAKQAKAQGVGGEFVGFLNQAVVGEIAGGILEGTGYLMDIAAYTNLVSDTEDDFANAFSDLGKGLKEWTREATPIMMNPYAKDFNPGSTEWWFSNGVSVASTVSLLIPAIGVVKGASMIGKALQLSKTLGTLSKEAGIVGQAAKFLAGEAGGVAARGVSQAIVSRHMESMMESSQVFDKLYKEYSANPKFTEAEARKAASDAAAQVYDRNWVMLVQDIPQYMLMNKFLLGKGGLGAKTLKAQGKNVPLGMAKNALPYAKDMVGEGFEEMYQYMVSQEAEYMTDKRMDMAVESQFSDRLDSYLRDGEMWTAFTMGMLGSGVQQTLGPVINKTINKIKDPGYQTLDERRADHITGYTAKLKHANERYREFAEAGFDSAAEHALLELISAQATRDAELGLTDSSIKFFEGIINASDEELGAMGVQSQDAELIKANSETVLADLNRFAEIVKVNQEKVAKGYIANSNQVPLISGSEFKIEKLQNKLDTIDTKLTEAKSNIDGFNELSEQKRAILDLESDIANEQKILSIRKKLFDKEKNNHQKSKRKSRIKMSEDNLAQYKSDLKDMKGAYSEEDKAADKPKLAKLNLKQFKEHDSLKREKKATEANLEEEKVRLNLWKKTATDLSSREEKNNYKAKKDQEKADQDLTPEEGELIVHQNDPEDVNKAAIFMNVNAEDEAFFDIQFLNNKGEADGNTVTVPRGSILYSTPQNEEEYDYPLEVLNDDNDRDYGTYKAPGNHAILVYSKGKAKDLVVFDEKLDAYISNPNNDLKEAKIIYELDIPFTLKNSKLPKAYKDKIKSGTTFSKDEIKYLLSNTDFLENAAIRAKLVDKGVLISDDIFIYTTDKVDQRQEHNAFRKNILNRLLNNQETWSTGVTKAKAGFFNNNRTEPNITLEELGEDINTLELAVVINRTTGGMKTENKGEDVPNATGKPANIYALTNLTPTGNAVPLKVNAQKLSREHAEIVWDALKVIYTAGNTGGTNATFPEGYDKVSPNLTAGDVLNYLVLWGAKDTQIDHPKRLVPFEPHMASKQLWYGKKTDPETGKLRPYATLNFGTSDILLHQATDEIKEDFIKWAMENKNYVVKLTTAKTDLNKVDKRVFKIGNIETDGKTRHATTLMKYGMVKTDARQVLDENGNKTGSIFRSPLLTISMNTSNIWSSKTRSEHSIALVPLKTGDPVRVDATPTVKEERQVAKVKLGKTAITSVEQVKNIPPGTELFIENKGKKVLVGVVVMRGKGKIFIKKANSDKLNKLNQRSIGNKDAFAKELLNIFNGSKPELVLHADVEMVAAPKAKATPKPNVEPVVETEPVVEPKTTPEEDIKRRREEEINNTVVLNTGTNEEESLNEVYYQATKELEQEAKDKLIPKEYKKASVILNMARKNGWSIEQIISKLSKEFNVKFNGGRFSLTYTTKINIINAKYDAELAALKTKPTATTKENDEDIEDIGFVGGSKPPTLPTRLADTTEDYEVQDLEVEVKGWLRKKFGKTVVDKVKIADRLIEIMKDGPEAFATYSHDAILLYRNAEEGTIFHEAWHRVSYGYLTTEEREAVIDSARRKYKMLTATETEVEERLAEEFRDYVMLHSKADTLLDFVSKYKSKNEAAMAIYESEAGRRTLNSIIRSIDEAEKLKISRSIGIVEILKEIYDFIVSIFTGESRLRTYDIDRIFASINRRKFKYAKIRPENVDNIQGTYAPRLAIKGGSLETITTSAQVRSIIKGLSIDLIKMNNIEDINDVAQTSIKFKPVIKMLDDSVEAFKKAGTEYYLNMADLYTEVSNDLKSDDSIYRELINDYLLSINIRKTSAADQLALDELISDTGIEKINKPSHERNSKDNILASVKFLVATTYASPDRNKSTHMFETVDFSPMWTSLKRDLAHLENIDAMIKVLETSDSYPYRVLAVSLKEAKDNNLRIQFEVAMREHRHNYLNVSLDDNHNVNISDASVTDTIRNQRQIWSQAFSQSDFITRETGQPLSLNETKFKEEQAKYTNLFNRFKNAYNKSDAFSATERLPYIEELVQTLGRIHVKIDNETIIHAISKAENKNKELYRIIEMSSAFYGFNKARLSKQTANKTHNPLLLSAYMGQFQSALEMAEMHVEAHPELMNDSHLGPGGNMYYTYSANSLVTDVLRAIKKNNDYLTKLRSASYSKRSVYAKQILEEGIAKDLKLFTFSGLFSTGEEGRDYMEMAPIDDYIGKLTLALKGYVIFPTMADKGTYYILKGLSLPEIIIASSNNGIKYGVNKEIEDIFYDYYLDEKDRILKAKEEITFYLNKVKEYKALSDKEPFKKQTLKKEILLLNEKFIEHYHFKKDDNRHKSTGDYYKDENGFFTETSLRQSNAIKFANFSYLNKEKGLTAKGDIDFSKHTEESIRRHIQKSISEQVENEIKYALEMGAIEYDTADRRYTAKLLDSSLTDSYQQRYGSYHNGTQALIAENTVRALINNIELQKLISGDPAFFKSRKNNESFEDLVKRLSGLTSTGQNLKESVEEYGRELEKTTYTTGVINTQKFQSASYPKLLAHHTEVLKERYTELYAKELEDGTKTRTSINNMAKKDAAATLKAFKEVDQADGQAYISPNMYRSISIRLGEWSQAKEIAFDLIQSDKELNVEESQAALAVVMQPLKLMHYGLVFKGDLAVPVYDKMSLATLFKPLVKGTQLQDVADRMDGVGRYAGFEKIDMFKLDTVTKTGATDGIDLYANGDRNEILDISNVITTTQEFKYLRRQLITAPHLAETATVGTQFIKIALSNIFKEKQIYNLAGAKITGAELIQEVNEMLSELSTRGQKKLNRKLGFDSDNGLITNKAKFVSFMKEEAKTAGLEDNLTDALRLDDTDNFYLNIDSMPNRKWIESRIISLINKNIVDRVLPGKQLIQMANLGIRGKLVNDSLEFVDLEVGSNTVTAMQAMVPISMFKSLIPNYDNQTFEQNAKFVMDSKLDEIIGYRIPTQGLSSIVALKVVKLLPEGSGDTIILPAEFTALTGSDFDIDKLFVIRHHYRTRNGRLEKVKFSNNTKPEYVESRRNRLAWELFNQNKDLFSDALVETIQATRDRVAANIYKNEKEQQLDANNLRVPPTIIIETLEKEGILMSMDEFKKLSINQQNSEAAIQNKLIDAYLGVLLNPAHYMEATSPLGSLDSELKIMRKFINAYDTTGDNEAFTSFQALTPSYNSKVKFNNSGGKTGVGPFALGKAHHVLAQMAGLVYSDKDSTFRLDEIYGNDKIAISEWFSILIDKHVDIAKDPMIMELNVNSETYDVVNFMLRAGFGGETTFMFTSQPVLKTYANSLINAKSYSNPISNKEVLKNLTATITNNISQLEGYKGLEKEELDKKIKSEVAKLTRDDVVNEKALKNRIKNNIQELTEADYIYDLAVLKTFGDLNKKGKHLFNLVMASRVDTRRYGKNFVELRAFINSARTVLNEGYFNEEALHKLIPNFQTEEGKEINMDNLFVANYFINAILYGKKLMAPISIVGTEGFSYIVDSILDLSGNGMTLNKKLINIVSDEAFASIVGKFFADKVKIKTGTVRNYMINQGNLFEAVNAIKNGNFMLDKNGKETYPELKDNKLIDYIIHTPNYDEVVPHHFRLTTTRLEDKWEKDDIVRAWNELLSHDSTAVQQLAKKLYVYSFYTTGFKNRLFGFNNLIPNELIKSSGLDDYLKETLSNFKSLSDETLTSGMNTLIEEVFENNWNLRSLIGLIKHESIVAREYADKANSKGLYGILVESNPSTMIGRDGQGRPVFKKYFVYKQNKTDQPTLFKNVGSMTKDNIVFNGVYVPVARRGYNKQGVVLREYGLTEPVIEEYKLDLGMSEEKMISNIESQYETTLIPITYNYSLLTEEAKDEMLEETSITEYDSNKIGFILSKDITGKDQGKANLANAYIGFGIERKKGLSSSGIYLKDAIKQGIPTNENIVPTTNTVAFVSVSSEGTHVEKTAELAKNVISNGGTIIMDKSGTNYGESHSSFNIKGEGAVQDLLGKPTGQTKDGYNYWKNNDATQLDLFEKMNNVSDQEALDRINECK